MACTNSKPYPVKCSCGWTGHRVRKCPKCELCWSQHPSVCAEKYGPCPKCGESVVEIKQRMAR
jgi:hypothetical protein